MKRVYTFLAATQFIYSEDIIGELIIRNMSCLQVRVI